MIYLLMTKTCLFFLLYLGNINSICKSLLMKYEGYTSQLTIAPSFISTF
jgi:hypothetical protein